MLSEEQKVRRQKTAHLRYLRNREDILKKHKERYERERDSILEKQRAYQQTNRAELLVKNRKYYRKFKYGLSDDSFKKMMEAQGGRCAVTACRRALDGSKGGAPCIDHDHKTGVVRGILCRLCNTALGHAQDDPDRLRSLAEYLSAARRP